MGRRAFSLSDLPFSGSRSTDVSPYLSKYADGQSLSAGPGKALGYMIVEERDDGSRDRLRLEMERDEGEGRLRVGEGVWVYREERCAKYICNDVQH